MLPRITACSFHFTDRYPANSRISTFRVKYHFVFAPYANIAAISFHGFRIVATSFLMVAAGKADLP